MSMKALLAATREIRQLSARLGVKLERVTTLQGARQRLGELQSMLGKSNGAPPSAATAPTPPGNVAAVEAMNALESKLIAAGRADVILSVDEALRLSGPADPNSATHLARRLAALSIAAQNNSRPSTTPPAPSTSPTATATAAIATLESRLRAAGREDLTEQIDSAAEVASLVARGVPSVTAARLAALEKAASGLTGRDRYLAAVSDDDARNTDARINASFRAAVADRRKNKTK